MRRRAFGFLQARGNGFAHAVHGQHFGLRGLLNRLCGCRRHRVLRCVGFQHVDLADPATAARHTAVVEVNPQLGCQTPRQRGGHDLAVIGPRTRRAVCPLRRLQRGDLAAVVLHGLLDVGHADAPGGAGAGDTAQVDAQFFGQTGGVRGGEHRLGAGTEQGLRHLPAIAGFGRWCRCRRFSRYGGGSRRGRRCGGHGWLLWRSGWSHAPLGDKGVNLGIAHRRIGHHAQQPAHRQGLPRLRHFAPQHTVEWSFQHVGDFAGLDVAQFLMLFEAVTLFNQPVVQGALFHRQSPFRHLDDFDLAHGQASITLRTAASMRSTLGIHACSSTGENGTGVWGGVTMMIGALSW